MLVLSRKQTEKIVIDDKIEIEVLGITDGKVKLGIRAPKHIDVHRGEVYEEIKESNKTSLNKSTDLSNLKNLVKNKKV